MRSSQEQVMEIFKMTGKVFDIRRFSTHDGDGIRTTVFLKGCPLKCVWCQNPEGISIRKRPIYFENRCIHCKTCIAKSKEHGVTLEEDQIHLHPDKNEDWNTIIEWCPTGAIAMDSREMTVEMVMEEIRKDNPFYRHGNGGVTISGGEPLLQWKFTKELFKACKKEGIHTAIETSLYAEQEVIKEILPYLDRIFADLKLATEKDHMHYTGVSNHKIKENIRYLLETSNRNKVIIRTPMIPGMTATRENIKGIAKYLNGIYQSVSYEILNYNPLAEAKYHLVDKEYCFEENPKLYTKEQMQEFKNWAIEGGLENIINEQI